MNDTVTRGLATLPGPIALIFLATLVPGCKRATENLGPSQAVAQGDGATPSPAPSPVASPSPTATPPPAMPENEPDPEPSPDCIHETDHCVDSVSLAVYFLECNG